MMSLMRGMLIAGSESRWLREKAPRIGFIKRATKRFMPGERLEDALGAATVMQQNGIATMLTLLGENITELAEAEAVTAHYVDAMTRVAQAGLDCQLSIKPTQLGIDFDKARCADNIRTLAASAQSLGNFVWIDMEQYRYVDDTLQLYTDTLKEFPNVGICLQAYLHRTPKDLAAVIPLGGGVRLVKGAYREPPENALPVKSDVDARYVSLAKQMLGSEAKASGFRAAFGTHDPAIIRTIKDYAAAQGIAKDGFDFNMMYGIQRTEERRLAEENYKIRVLISYGDYWVPWYTRRLAERPANVWFVARTMFAR